MRARRQKWSTTRSERKTRGTPYLQAVVVWDRLHVCTRSRGGVRALSARRIYRGRLYIRVFITQGVFDGFSAKIHLKTKATQRLQKGHTKFKQKAKERPNKSRSKFKQRRKQRQNKGLTKTKTKSKTKGKRKSKQKLSQATTASLPHTHTPYYMLSPCTHQLWSSTSHVINTPCQTPH